MRATVLSVLAQLRAQGVGLYDITADSRQLKAGDIFAAFPGYATDGRKYIQAAIERGTTAVLWESGDGFQPEALPVPSIPVEGLREKIGCIADEVYECPSEKLWVAGVTGTNGKTTVSQWLARALCELGASCGIIGTLGCGFPGALTENTNTTPDAATLHRTLARFATEGAQAAAIEVSSIGLDQGRVNGVRFNLAIFTNLTRDHLDYHGTMDAYATAKARLFSLPGCRQVVINFDDSFGLAQARRLVSAGIPVIGYTQIKSNALAVPGARVLIADRVQAPASGLRFTVMWEGEAVDITARMVAPFNISNLLAVIGALLAYGFPLGDILPVVGRLTPPEGRMQLVGGVGEPLVVIDYAHSPDALEQVLKAVRETADARSGRVLCVFGCGGDRDSGKRPLMGKVASAFADHVVITSDNPRGEDPEQIIAEIMAGVDTDAENVVDRAEAIRTVVGRANVDDVIVVAGKGHEPYQEIRGVRLPFSDLEQARQALANWGRGEQ